MNNSGISGNIDVIFLLSHIKVGIDKWMNGCILGKRLCHKVAHTFKTLGRVLSHTNVSSENPQIKIGLNSIIIY